jgi:hypothetical protein
LLLYLHAYAENRKDMKSNCTIIYNFNSEDMSSNLVLVELHYREKHMLKLKTF